MYLLLAFIIAYLLGSINSAILVGRLWKNIDIREYGSGNAGFTNILRTLGKLAAAVVLMFDVLKGVVAILIGSNIAGTMGGLVAGIAAVLGHNFPVYFGFKGGKGVLTSIAVATFINWKIGLLIIVIALTIMIATRYVSLGSLIGATLYPFLVYFIDGRGIEYIIFAIFISALAIYRHKANIGRLLSGTESKVGEKGSKK